MSQEPIDGVHGEGEDGLGEEEPQNADSVLEQLYKSARPPVELVPGVALSAIVNAAWLPRNAKVHKKILRYLLFLVITIISKNVFDICKN